MKKIQQLIILIIVLLISENYECGQIMEVTRRNVFDAIRDNSPIIILFKDSSEDSEKMLQAFQNTMPYLDQMAPPLTLGVFSVTPEHQVPRDFMIYSFPMAKLFTGFEIPKVYAGRANEQEIIEWLSMIFEGSASSSKLIENVAELEQLEKNNEFVMTFLGQTEDNPDFTLYLNIIKKVSADDSSIKFANSNKEDIKRYLKIKQSSSNKILFYNRKEDQRYEYPQQNLDFFNIISFIEESKICKFYKFSKQQLESFEQQANNVLVLLIDSDASKQSNLIAEIGATRNYFLKTNIQIGFADPYDWDNKFLQKFNLTNDELPQLVYMNMDSINTNINPKKYRFDTAYSNEKITRDSIIKFYEDAMDNKIAQFYNGEYMDEEEKEINEELFVKKIVAENYEKFISPEDDSYSLILYLKDDCRQCASFRKKWLETIKYFKKAKNIQFGIINLSKNDHPKIRVSPPHCLLFNKDESKQMSISDFNTAMELKNWIQSNANLEYEQERYEVKGVKRVKEAEEQIEL